METINNEDKFDTKLIDQNEILKLLDKYTKNNKNEKYLNILLFYYMILPPEICKKYKINKIKTEEETFFEIINDLINKFGDQDKSRENKTTENDLYEHIDNILKLPAQDELKDLGIKEIPSRWNKAYSKIKQFENEANNELIFYNQTKDLLLNIKENKRPFEIIYFLVEFMKIFKNFKFKWNDMPINTKKFILLGLSNCEYVEYNYGFLNILEIIGKMEDLQRVERYIKINLNPKYIYNGILLNIIKKFANSKLASSAFIKIFKSEIPKEIQEEIFSDNIIKYISFFPFSSFDKTEKTLRWISLILINPHKDKKYVFFKNNVINKLLSDFSNLVIRKVMFGRELQHLSEGLLYNGNSVKKEDRVEKFELLSYGKVFKLYSIYDLLFIADEANDNLDIDEHLKKYQNYLKKEKILLDELKNFPKEQLLSKLVFRIYCELSEDKETYDQLLKNPFIACSNEEFIDNDLGFYNNEDYIANLENSITPEICPFSLSKEIYTRKYYKI